jgi:hypothetical protein
VFLDSKTATSDSWPNNPVRYDVISDFTIPEFNIFLSKTVPDGGVIENRPGWRSDRPKTI